MEQYSIFNSENGDRKYLAEDFAEFFLPFFKNGIFDNGLKVVAGTGMQVEIKTGRAFCNGYRYRNKDNSIVKPIAIADGEQSRIDNVVLRLDLTNRTFTSQVVQGSYSNSPVAPILVRDTTTYDLRLAKVSIPAGITEITDDLITDCRFDSSDCGNVIQAVQTADFTDLFKQFETEFYNWFDDLEVTLDENTATNLTNRVINLENNSAFIDTCTDEDLEDVTDTNECLKDNDGNVINPKIPRYENLKNNTIISGTAIKSIQGTMVRYTATNSVVMFTFQELNELFGVDNCTYGNILAFVCNGDGNANSVHFNCATLADDSVYATFDTQINSTVRINYIIFYLG